MGFILSLIMLFGVWCKGVRLVGFLLVVGVFVKCNRKISVKISWVLNNRKLIIYRIWILFWFGE